MGLPPFNPQAPGADGPTQDGEDGSLPDDDGGLESGGVSFLGCCQRHDEPGCQDPEVAACVCAAHPECCDDAWSESCVLDGIDNGCMQCSQPPDDGADAAGGSDGAGPVDGGGSDGGADGGAGDGGGLGDCCTPSATGGCADPAVAACVCMTDAFCCDSEWDDVCVGLVDGQACGTCGGATGGGMDSDGGSPPGTCCAALESPGCSDPALEACVCFEDDFCCEFAWDDVCVELVTSAQCGAC